MLASLGIGSLGIVLLGVAIWMWRKEMSRRLITVCMLVAGLTMTGALSGLLMRVAEKIQTTLATTGAKVLGVSVSAIVFLCGVLILAELWMGLKGNGHGGMKGRRGRGMAMAGGGSEIGWFLPILALLAPALLVAGGGFIGGLTVELMTSLKSVLGG